MNRPSPRRVTITIPWWVFFLVAVMIALMLCANDQTVSNTLDPYLDRWL